MKMIDSLKRVGLMWTFLTCMAFVAVWIFLTIFVLNPIHSQNIAKLRQSPPPEQNIKIDYSHPLSLQVFKESFTEPPWLWIRMDSAPTNGQATAIAGYDPSKTRVSFSTKPALRQDSNGRWIVEVTK